MAEAAVAARPEVSPGGRDWEAFEAAGRALLAQAWIFAKTMPENPHEYTLRKRWADDGAFVRTVEYIRAGGYTAVFKGRPYRQLDVNAHFYWTMGAPLPATILINRKVRPAVAAYDPLAAVYDDLFTDAESRAEDAAVLDLLGDLSGASVLDVGCGTGWLLDHAGEIGAYTGMDPSAGMLARLRRKHPAHAEDVLCTPLRAFVAPPRSTTPAGRYDRVVALYGAGSYLDADELARLPRLLAPGGRYVVMVYAPGYLPKTHRQGAPLLPARPWEGRADEALTGAVLHLSNYLVIEGRGERG